MVTRSVGANDGLSSERHYTTKTLPRGVVRGMATLSAATPRASAAQARSSRAWPRSRPGTRSVC